MTYTPQRASFPKHSSFEFSEGEVLHNDFDRRQRQKDLYKAVLLGNVFSSPVSIWVEGVHSCLNIQHRVTAVSQRMIFFENGTTIPIRAICRVWLN